MRPIFCLVDQKVCTAACINYIIYYIASNSVSVSEKIPEWDLGIRQQPCTVLVMSR